MWHERSIVLTPYGVNEILSAGPVQFGFMGGDVANVSPPVAHTIGQATTLILKGGFPESKIGDGKLEGCSPGSNFKVAGSIAYCQLLLASNCRSSACGC